MRSTAEEAQDVMESFPRMVPVSEPGISVTESGTSGLESVHALHIKRTNRETSRSNSRFSGVRHARDSGMPRQSAQAIGRKWLPQASTMTMWTTLSTGTYIPIWVCGKIGQFHPR